MIEADDHELRLWDTPGFGDTGRLLKRLKRESNPVLWFLSQAWDRFREKPLWHSQQALKNVREEADVVLYLVNAAESPGRRRMWIRNGKSSAWLRKPVLVLINQVGPARGAVEELAEVEALESGAVPLRHRQGRAASRRVRPLLGAGGCVDGDHRLRAAGDSARDFCRARAGLAQAACGGFRSFHALTRLRCSPPRCWTGGGEAEQCASDHGPAGGGEGQLHARDGRS